MILWASDLDSGAHRQWDTHSSMISLLLPPSLLCWKYWSPLWFFFSFIFISWRLITLQYCNGFCHTLTWISYGFTRVPHPDPRSHLPLHPWSPLKKKKKPTFFNVSHFLLSLTPSSVTWPDPDPGLKKEAGLFMSKVPQVRKQSSSASSFLPRTLRWKQQKSQPRVLGRPWSGWERSW